MEKINRNSSEKVSPQSRAAAHLLAACKILREMKTPLAKRILEELEPYVSEIAELKRGCWKKPV